MLGLVSLFTAGTYVGWNIGANDASNCIGTTVGSGLLNYRRSILLVGTFVVVGALLQGQHVMHTVGKGIVTIQLPVPAVLAALISAGLFVTAATFFKLPVSTSQAIVGGMAGVGLAAGAPVDFSVLANIAAVWVIDPFLCGIMAFGLYHLVALYLRRVKHPERWDRMLKSLLIISAAYTAFSLGANDVGNSVGPIANLGISPIWLGLLGGISLAVGAYTFGHRVTETVGGGITTLDPLSAFAAQAAAALAVHLFSILGIPVSTSQSIVGAVVGVGLVKGTRAIRKRRISGIAVGWIATPTSAGIFSFLLYRLISVVL